VLPVDVKRDAQSSCGFVDAGRRNQHDRRSTLDGRGKTPVLGQQDSVLFGAARGEYAVGKPTCGNDSVVTSRTQPSAEAAQHLVAKEPQLSATTRRSAIFEHHLPVIVLS
jgi:hypothetical protein